MRAIIVWIVALALLVYAAHLAGWHIKHKPTEDELFGCKNTYINPQGEDTGECR